MEFEQERTLPLEKKIQEEQAKHLSEILDPKELLMAKLSYKQLIPAEMAKGKLTFEFGATLFSGEANTNTPLRVEWGGGRAKPADVEWEPGVLVLLSGRVKDLLEEHGISGWKSYPVCLYDKFGKPVEGYSALGVTGRCGPADPAKALKRLRVYPSGFIGYEYYGNYFDPESWDGSDIFVADGEGPGICVTERVKKLLKKKKIKHVAVDTSLEDTIWEGFEIMYPELVQEGQ